MNKLSLAGICLVGQAFAITGGPNMPEYTQFEEVSANNLVDPNTGNFTYVIPLLEVPGPGGSYPVALSYHSGIRHNQEASWVGLGWSLNVGAINRVLRGVPDDYFNSMLATRNIANASGRTIGVNLGLGPLGLAMSWDANTGSFIGATPSLSLTQALLPGVPGVLGPIGLSVNLSPGAVSVGLGGSLPVGTVSMGLYNSANNSAGSGLGFNPNIGGVSISRASGQSIGTAAGEGTTTYESFGISIPIGKFSIGVTETDWRYTLNEAILDYMCGFLFQDGVGAGFINRVPGALSYMMPYSTTNPPAPPPPRQRYERSKFGDTLMPSSDIYQVSGNGIGGSFQPQIEPQTTVPIIVDGGGANNEGYLIQNPATFGQITFRMDGDKGFNLLHSDQAVTGQLSPATYNSLGSTRNQYGSYRIMPVFNKPTQSGAYSNVLTGFVIQNADGMTYEYRMPVMTLMQGDYAFKDPTKATFDRMEKMNAENYANSWLLTAVKGADYMPLVAGTEQPGPGDFGHWVKFNYTSPTLVNWSAPFTGNLSPDPKSKGEYYSRSYGIRQQVYLRSIETETHLAEFNLVDRVDVPKSNNGPVVALPSTTEMKIDDGLIASTYTSSNRVYADLPASGAFPARYSDMLWPNEVSSASITLRFPEQWGAALKSWRNANCGGVQCADEKFIGFLLHFTWRRENGNGTTSYPDARSYTTTQPFDTTITFDNGFSIHHEHYHWTANCNSINIVNGVAEVGCNISWWGDEFTGHLDIQSAFINWPEMEKRSVLTYNKPQALASIALKNKSQPARITKEIRFGYDYSLCNNLYSTHPGISGVEAQYRNEDVYLSTNNTLNKGKLTLKRVSIYGDGGRAGGTVVKLPDYTFAYQSGEYNPDFGNDQKNDMWGMYSPTGNQITKAVKQSNAMPAGSTPDGGEKVGVAWNLTRINLPTGGNIRVDYKRDEYYFAGIATDSLTNQKMMFPDVFSLDLPLKSDKSAIDWDKFYKLGINTTIVNYDKDIRNNNPYGRNIPILNTSSNGTDDYPITAAGSAPIEPLNGEIALVAFVMERETVYPNFANAFTGIANIVIVNRTDLNGTKRVFLHPLVQKDGANKFFYYRNFVNVYSGRDYRFSYYLIPIRNYSSPIQNLPKKFYGGDVAVSSLTMADGLGGSLTKTFSYYAESRRRGDGAYVDPVGAGSSSGATWALPDLLPNDEFKKYQAPPPSAPPTPNPAPFSAANRLNFDPWPYWCHQSEPGANPITDCGGENELPSPPLTPTFNRITDFLERTYSAEKRPRGYYYPEPGITYSRTRESGSGGPGYTEYQFYNLSHYFLNGRDSYSQVQPDVNYRFNGWSESPGLVTGTLLAMDSKLIRKYQVTLNESIVQKNENEYETDVTVYHGPTSASSTPVPLGALQQMTAQKIGTGNPVYSSFRVPVAHLVTETSVLDGVTNTVSNVAFDAKSGSPLVSLKTNSDNSGIATYKIPLHWGGDQALANNRLNLIEEERVYAVPSGTTFDRANTSRIVSASKDVWSNVPVQVAPMSTTTSGFLYKLQSHQWFSVLGANGLANTAYASPNANFDFPWKPKESKVTLINPFGYPLETLETVTGLYSAEYTGHNSNLVVGSIQNSRWEESSIFTGDYRISQFSQVFDKLTGWKGSSSSSVYLTMNSSATSGRCISIGSNSSLFNDYIKINSSNRKTLRASFRGYVNSGSLTLRIQPKDQNGNSIGSSRTDVMTNTGAWEYRELEIDLTQSQWSGATKLSVELITSIGGSSYVEDIRVHPSNALAKTYFYDPVTYKLLAVRDENGNPKSFSYDGLGRLTSKANHDGEVMETYQYNNMINPQ